MTISLSIIIPSYNEEQLLPLCLNGILQQKNELGPNGEIIIAVNGSTDRTLELARSYEKEHSNIKVLDIKQANKKLAMNSALDIAKNRYVVFCDADSFLDSNALRRVKKKLQKNKYAIIGAIRRPLVNKKIINVNFPETYFMLHYAKRLSLKSRDRLSVQGWLMAIDLDKFDNLRFPMDNSPDDIWLSAYTWMHLGKEFIGYIPRAIGTYIPPTTLEDMERQILRHRSNHKTVQKYHPEFMPYFVARKAYYSSIKGTFRWRLKAISMGIDFNAWILPYQEFLTTVDDKVALGEYVYGQQVSWERVSSSKLAPQVVKVNSIVAEP